MRLWLWLRAVVLEHNPKGAFNHALWPIFQQPRRWNMLVGGMSYALVTPDTLQASMTAHWTWPEGSIITDPDALAAWFGMYMGVTPTWAHFILEPYAHRRTQGCYYSPIDLRKTRTIGYRHTNVPRSQWLEECLWPPPSPLWSG